MLNKKHDAGVTLVEVLIAMVILLVVYLGLIQASLLIVDNNTRNEVRDEAIRIAADSMNTIRGLSFDNILACDENTAGTGCGNIDPILDPNAAPALGGPYIPPRAIVTRTVRNSKVIYNITTTVVILDIENKQVTVTVSYLYPPGGQPGVYPYPAGVQPVYQILNSIVRRS